jgi:hypothetical protein
MCSRHLPPHRFVCIADRDVPGVETLPISTRALRWGKRYPKLQVWRDDMPLGARVLLLDLDCVILGDLSPLLDREDDVVLWRDPSSRRDAVRYNTSMVLLRVGSHPEVWDDFSPGRGRRRGPGTDQAWVREALGPDMPTWDAGDGVLSYKSHCRPNLPGNARVVFFHGNPKPWALDGWVKEHYR